MCIVISTGTITPFSNNLMANFSRRTSVQARPLISQEMSTGYPNGETGHPTRFYTLVHQTPQSLIGNLAYEYNNPAFFLEAQSFITGELAEALRRSNDKAAGFLSFCVAHLVP